MATSYHYALAVWLRLKTKLPMEELAEELREYLVESGYHVLKLEAVNELLDKKKKSNRQIEISLRLQFTFTESEMDSDEPTEEALEEVYQQLKSLLEDDYEVAYLEVLDDALTSFLLGKSDDGSL